MDGSAGPFVFLLQSAGIVEQDAPKRYLRVLLPIEVRDDLSPVRLYAKVAEWILFDARAPREATRPGGLGKSFDWRLLENLSLNVPFMLSGGLEAGNVEEALRITSAPAVDVSSGVERAPGIKDPEKIRAFVRAARLAESRLGKAKSTA